jgi:hypothetical protein
LKAVCLCCPRNVKENSVSAGLRAVIGDCTTLHSYIANSGLRFGDEMAGEWMGLKNNKIGRTVTDDKTRKP